MSQCCEGRDAFCCMDDAAEIESLKAINAQLLKTLESVQWGSEELCRPCGAFSGGGHNPACPVNEVIKKAKETS